MTTLDIIGIIIAILNSPLVIQGVAYLYQKTKSTRSEQVFQYVQTVVEAVEQIAAARPDLKLKGQAKLNEAVNRIRQKYPSLPIKEAETLIEAALRMRGITKQTGGVYFNPLSGNISLLNSNEAGDKRQ